MSSNNGTQPTAGPSASPRSSVDSKGGGEKGSRSSTDSAPGKAQQQPSGAALNESLTSIDWLPRLSVGRGRDDGKPPYSYATLITFAINSAKGAEKKMTLAEIYEWIQQNYPYFQTADKGWKNSVRHNLSLNKMFRKVSRDPADHGKGCYWAINESYDPDVDGSKTSRKRKKKTSSDTGEEAPKRASTTASESQAASAATAHSHQHSGIAAVSPTSSMSAVLQQADLADLLGSQPMHSQPPTQQPHQQHQHQQQPQSQQHDSQQPQSQPQPQPQHQQRQGVSISQAPLLGTDAPATSLLSSANPAFSQFDLSASLSAFNDLNSSFSKIYSGILQEEGPATTATGATDIATSAAPPASSSTAGGQTAATSSGAPVLTFEAVQGVMSNLESNPMLLESLDQGLFRKTQTLVKNVQDDVALSGNWLQSTHFPNLATSFNHLLQSSTNPLASMDLSSLPLATKQSSASNMFDVEEEEEFDWDTLPMA